MHVEESQSTFLANQYFPRLHFSRYEEAKAERHVFLSASLLDFGDQSFELTLSSVFCALQSCDRHSVEGDARSGVLQQVWCLHPWLVSDVVPSSVFFPACTASRFNLLDTLKRARDHWSMWDWH